VNLPRRRELCFKKLASAVVGLAPGNFFPIRISFMYETNLFQLKAGGMILSSVEEEEEDDDDIT
jgi:hypothetical protein